MIDSVRRPVTAHDVAKLAGVSQSAVSRTFTKGASVAEATRAKVMEAATTLGYRPNLVARSLITRRSGLIGVVVPSMTNPFYAEVLECLSKALEPEGYRVLLFSTAHQENSDPIMEDVLRHRVDALIMVSASLSSRFADECKRVGLPVAMLNRKVDSPAISSVTGDNTDGGALIADYLVQTGHRRPAFIAGAAHSSTSRDREQSFYARLAQLGQNQPLREMGNFDMLEAMAATQRLLALPEPPDAIFCANDLTAIAVLNVMFESGISPGKDISVVGFDNIKMANWPLLGLTTYAQPIERMARKAVDVIQAQLEDISTPAIHEVVRGELIIRSSSRIPCSIQVSTVDGMSIWQR
ncbi:LacI family transcriptional regulator [Pseudomonas putida]|uniref:LacI family transcriptional regulator n=1 Tax=Pseudomonas putida TaxID=303 RepID=A0A4D6XCQ2_PSEPU|nr:LacI family DNA-binding transcriptional regulator [Pseudomonas putida]QCI13499.1 LacI family transcriptional regulator [Pseudomonas putida]